jgi:spermidine/putrescine transport system substrate-binding protein
MQGTARLITFPGYAPPELIKKFETETGIKVEVTDSSNEDMIAKLRATRGGGFDLAKPRQNHCRDTDLWPISAH